MPEYNPVVIHWKNFVSRLHKDKPLQVLVILIGALSVVVILTIITLFIFRPSNNLNPPTPVTAIDIEEENGTQPQERRIKEAEEEIVSAEESLVLPRRIDGLIVAREHANKVPACVMIENAAFGDVRPQSGISAASVVYEIIVEGGITRWMAVFAGETANTVGPVRSARDTYLEFASEYNCAYAHAGGSFTALQALQNFGLRDLDGLREPKWFWRDTGKVAPHNFFTNTPKLEEAITFGHSWTEEPTYDSWTFFDDEDIIARSEETASEINIYFGGAYDVKYVYNQEGKYYERWNGGVLSIDATTGESLKIRNIIIQRVPPGEEIEGKSRINFSVTGEGGVEIYRLGKRVTGFWKKLDRLSRTYYVNGNNENIPLARGATWVEIVPETHGFDWK